MYTIISMAYWWWSIHSRDTHIWYRLYYPNWYLSHKMKRTRNDPIPSWTVSTYRWCIGTNYFWWSWKHLFGWQMQHIYLDDIDTIETTILTWLKTVLCTTCEGEGTTASCGCGCCGIRTVLWGWTSEGWYKLGMPRAWMVSVISTVTWKRKIKGAISVVICCR